MKRIVGLALLLCGGLGCEAVLEDTDMTLDELRQALVEQSGHTGLVTDAEGADYSDKSGLLTNATYYLNSGLRWLNRLWGTPGQARFYETTLAQGEWAKQIPNLRHARHVYIHDGTTRYRLQYRNLAWLKKMYDEPFDNVDQDRPRYWSRAEDNWAVEPEDAVELITNGGFDDDLTGWTTDQPDSWAVEDGVAVFQGVDEGQNPALRMSLADDPVTGATELSLDLTIESGEVFVSDASFTYQATVTESGTCTIAILPSSTITGIYIIPQSIDAVVSVDNVFLGIPAVEGVKADIITMPPADASYTLKVYGDFKTTDLSADADENWWTEQHPEFVIRAARIMLELDGHRNISGLEAFKGMCEEDVARLAAEHRFAYISGFTPEEAARYG